MTRIFFSTIDSLKGARALSNRLLKLKLVACVNIIPGVESHYVWKNKQERSKEFLLIGKTTKAKLPALKRALESHHPYDVPEFVVLPISDGLPSYLNWVKDSVR